MSKVLNELSESARNSTAMVMQRLATTNNGDLASQLAIDPSSFSRFVNDKKSNNLTTIEMISELLHLIGLKIVQTEDVYCSVETAEATRELLKNCFNSPEYMRILFK